MSSSFALLLGAGASQPYGVPTMAKFYEDFRQHVITRHPQYASLLEQLEAARGSDSADLETLLSDLQLTGATADGLTRLGIHSGEATQAVQRIAELRGFMDAFIVDACEHFDREASARDFANVLALRDVEPLWVFSTNYDRIVEHACDRLRIPFSDGFAPGVGNPVADWTGVFDESVRIVKLHGSVNWYRDQPGPGLHRLDRGYSLPTKDFALVRSGQSLVPLMIIPTLEKQVLDRPYANLTVHFTDVTRDLKLLIIIGNSLRDRHLLTYISHRTPQLQILMVSPRASTNVKRLRLAGAHALDIGVHELFSTSAVALRRLADAVHASTDPTEVSSAIQKFVAEVTSNVEADRVMRSDPALEIHAKKLGDSSVSERARAAAALRDFAHPVVVSRLGAVLRDDPSEFVRAAAVGALVGLGTPNALTTAGRALSDPSAAVQLEAVTGFLAVLPNPDAEAKLRDAKDGLTPAARRVLEKELV